MDLFHTKKIQNIIRNIFQNKIKQIKKNISLLQNTLTHVKKRKRLFGKGLKKFRKNLSQNEFNQIAEMRGQSRDELEQIAKLRRIKNYEEMTIEELIITLLISKQSIAELFNNNNNNNNLYDNEISDLRRILRRLRDISPKKGRQEIRDKLYEIEHQRNISEEEKEGNDEYLRKLVRILNNKEKYSTHNYYVIRDIPILFGEASEEHSYEPILVKTSLNGNLQIS